MIREIIIENFKLFENVRISDLKQINIFLGKNNVGKSSILEALAIFIEAIDNSNLIDNAGRISSNKIYPWKGKRFRDLIRMQKDLWKIRIDTDRIYYKAEFKLSNNILYVTHNLNNDVTIQSPIYQVPIFSDQLFDKIQDNNIKTTFINFKKELLNSCFITNQLPDIPSYSDLPIENKIMRILAEISEPTNANKRCDLLAQLRKIRESKNISLRDIWCGWIEGTEAEARSYYSYKNTPYHINLVNEGFAFKRLLEILVNIISMKEKGDTGLVLLEEPENGLSFDNFSKLAEIINNNINEFQFFITTHNIFMIEQLVELINNDQIFSIFVIDIVEEDDKTKIQCIRNENVIKEVKKEIIKEAKNRIKDIYQI
jgi:AAA15 family ATPase/GTPase